MEGGIAALSDQYWLSIQTQFTDFDNAVVLMGVPEYGGDTYSDGYPAIARIRNVKTAGQVSFETRLYIADDAFCLKTWYTPQPIIPAVPVSWMVVEQGAYELSLAKFMIGKGLVNRINSDVTNQDNFVKFDYPTGCTSPTAVCAFDSAETVGLVLQLQTVVYERLLIPRGVTVQKRFSKVVLQPHDATDSTYYEMPRYETLAYMAFDTSVEINCFEFVALETRKFSGVSFLKQVISLSYVYKSSPGVFAALNSAISLADSTGLRVTDRTTRKVSLITQEDQCYDEETIHTTPEVIAAVVIGERSVRSSCLVCKVHFSSIPINKQLSNNTSSSYDKRRISEVDSYSAESKSSSSSSIKKGGGRLSGLTIVCALIAFLVVVYAAFYIIKLRSSYTLMDRAFGRIPSKL